MSFRWQEKHMLPFLEAYRQQECLWNTKCKDYKKASVRERAYKSMVAALNIPGLVVADVKSKIKTIRTKYGAELTKIRTSEISGATADEIYEPRLFWFKDADAFLRDVCASKFNSLYMTVKDSEFISEKDNTSYATHSSHQYDPLEQPTTDIEDINEVTSPEHTENSSAATPTVIAASTQNCKKVRKRSHYPSVSAINEAAKRYKQISDDHQYPNEFDVFCKSLAIQLKKMPLHRALICQEKLQSVMTQERLSQLSQSHLSMLPSSSGTYRQSMDMGNPDKYCGTPSSGPSIHSESD